MSRGPHLPSPGEREARDQQIRDAHAYVDRELSRAERAHVENLADRHDGIQLEIERVERLSGLLKAWDGATRSQMPTPARRISHAVLGEVRELAWHRRIERRRQQIFGATAAAAAVLVVVLGALLGLESARNQPAPEGRIVVPGGVASAPFDPAEAASWSKELERPGASPDSVVVAELPDLPADQLDEAFPSQVGADWLDASRLSFLADLEGRRRAELAFFMKHGEPGVWLPFEGPDGRGLLVFAHTYEGMRRMPAYGRFVPQVRPEPAPTRTTDGSDRSGVATGQRAIDVLGDVPGFQAAPGAAATADAAPQQGAVRARRLRAIPKSDATARARRSKDDTGAGLPDGYALVGHDFGSPRPGKAHPGLRSTDGVPAQDLEVLDVLVAQDAGALRMRELEHVDELLVLFVKDTTQPIYVPVGQLIEGGRADRVLAEPLFIPPTQGEHHVELRCRVVSRGTARARGGPRFTRFVAGPMLRSALTRGADRETVLQMAEAQVIRLGRDVREAFSLLACYQGQGTNGAIARWEAYVFRTLGERRYAAQGWVFLDGEGNLLGVERIGFGGTAGRRLLARLYAGCLAESVLRDLGTEPHPVQTPLATLTRAAALLRADTVSLQTRRLTTGAQLLEWSDRQESNGLPFVLTQVRLREGQHDAASLHVSLQLAHVFAAE